MGKRTNAVIISVVGTTENPRGHCEHISEICGAYMVAWLKEWNYYRLCRRNMQFELKQQCAIKEICVNLSLKQMKTITENHDNQSK